MGGYVTWRRRVPENPGDRYTITRYFSSTNYTTYPLIPEGDNDATYAGGLWNPVQTTMSYRTGRDGGEDTDLLNAISSAGSYAGAARQIKTLDSLKESSYDQGHLFETERLSWDFSLDDFSGYDMYYRLFEGTVRPKWPTTFSHPRDTAFSLPSMEMRGRQAISDTIPTKSPASLAQALIELKREGVPRLIGATLSRQNTLRNLPKAGSEEFLNLEFGIKPLIRDLQDATRAVLLGREILKKYLSEAGEKLHRTRTYPAYNEVSVIEDGSRRDYIHDQPSGLRNCFVSNGVGDLFHTVEVSVTDYFTGAYTYYLDPEWFKGMSGYAKQAEHLLGLEITPEVLWEITPWSWLVDWVSDIGNNISNLTALGSDGLVLRYGYMMRQLDVTHTRTLVGVRNRSYQTLDPIVATCKFTSKKRIRATPYGFGLDLSDFTDKQWAILSALGMTRGNRSLRLSD